jgi:hypothetical protein
MGSAAQQDCKRADDDTLVHSSHPSHSVADGSHGYEIPDTIHFLCFLLTFCSMSFSIFAPSVPTARQMYTLRRQTLTFCSQNYFIATIREQYIYMLNSVEAATKINDFFDWALPIGGVISTPFLGALLDNVSTPGVLLILVFIITAIGIIGSIPALWAGYVNVILFVFLRPLYYSAMSDYATKVFGFATFGRVYGAIVCFSGLVNLSQTGIDALTKSTFGGNPIPVNAFLTISAFLIGTSLVIYVTVQVYRMRKMLDQDDAITVTNTDVGSIMESLLEEDEERNYGSIQRGRPSWEA